MEELLSPREFIKRFHLPQLVRISTSHQLPPPVADHDQHVAAGRDENANYAPRGQPAPPKRPEQRDLGWTYSSGGAGESGSKSLHFADPTRGHQGGDANAQGPVSLNACAADGPQAARMLPRVKLSRVTAGESFNRTRPLNDQTFLRPTMSRSDRTNSTNQQSSAKRDQFKSSSSASASFSCLNNIKLMPPSKRPTLSKLELEQPFLIYKAHRKLEICAYAADANNQLHDKSGDPIYFPHNYQGWFSIRPTTTTRGHDKSAQKTASEIGQRLQKNDPEDHLDTLDQVCQAGGQVFLTRDELIGYRLPSRLSHLTKLKNNQLLAVPLAINLTPTSGSGDTRGSEAGAKKASQKRGAGASSSINDLRQCVIGAGKVLRICGIYEDVLPLIEGASKQQQHQNLSDLSGSKFHQAHIRTVNRAADQRVQWAANGHTSHYYGQPSEFPPTTSQVGHQQQTHQHQQPQQQVVYGPSVASSAVARRDQRLIRQQQQQMVAPPMELIYQNNVRQQHHQSGQFMGVQPTPVVASAQSGRRYARCVILSDESVDQLTGCATPGGATGPSAKCDSAGETDAPTTEPPEVEVLIPLNLLGRFYLCATSQTLANELHCHDCSLAAHRSAPFLVFRMSQIVYLLNVNKRLSHHQAAISSRSHWRPFSSSFALPLQVRLVMGPRPASFSPAMFGLSSTMESYFSSEHNVGAHLLACKYNRTSSPVARPSARKTTKDLSVGDPDPATPTSTPVCACPQLLRPAGGGGAGGGLGWFSGSLRLDSVVKRDVLLACTIKQSPLEHSDLVGHHLSAATGGESTSGPQQKSSLRGGAKAKRALAGATLGPSSRAAAKSSTRLDELLETTAAGRLGPAAGAIPKSSMSRLRACRSLISLNGRRQKKKRPDIPSSMLSATVRQLAGPARGGATGCGGDFIDKMGAQLATAQLCDSSGAPKTAGLEDRELGEPIILIELDCNAEEDENLHDQLMIARTFVERSLPASSIPDLVVNRMNYCQANSHLWERQLKLSQASLSRDFDSCKRQLASLMARQARDDDDQNENLEREPLKQQVASHSLARQSGPLSLLFIGEDQQKRGHAAAQYDQRLAAANTRRGDQQTGGNLTASSRSSSGVSSSGEHHRAHFMLSSQGDCDPGRHTSQTPMRPREHSSSTSSSLSNLGASASSPGGGSSSTGTSTRELNSASQQQQQVGAKVRTTAKHSRLLRLVQKILPSSSSSASRSSTVVADCRPQAAPLSAAAQQQHSTSSGCDVSSASNSTTLSNGERRGGRGQQHQRQQLKLMEELNGRFRTKLSLMVGSDVSAPDSSPVCDGAKVRNTSGGCKSQRPTETLMNAQKVHKRLLMTGSMRHLPSELLNRMMEDQDDERERRHERPFDSKSCTLNDDDDDDDADDSSHLYESLERLNSDCLQGESPGAGASDSRQQVHEPQQHHASHSSRLMMKIQLIKQQQRRRRQPRESLWPERAPGAIVARSRPGLGGGNRQTAEEDDQHDDEDEWQLGRGASSGDDEAAAARATSGCASGNARRPLAVLPSWRQRLVASVGGGGGQQRKLPTQSGKRPARESRLCHSMELFGGGGEFDGIRDPQRQQLTSCSDAESCDAGEQLDMEPVSIEACEQHAGRELSASDDDDDDERRPVRAASDRIGDRRDNDSTSSSASSSFASSSCSLTSAGQQQQQHKRLIGTALPATAAADCDIYVNLVPPRAANSWTSLDELAPPSRVAARTPEAERGREMSRRNSRLVDRMERKLAKLRGRKELAPPTPRRATPASKLAEPLEPGGGELRSLGWEPADELRAHQQRSLPSIGSNGESQSSMNCIIGETKPVQVRATQGGGGSSASSSLSRARSSSSSSTSSSLCPTRAGDQTDTFAESKVETTTTEPVAHGNGGCQRGRAAEAASGGGGQRQHTGTRPIVTLDRPSAVVVAASAVAK